MQITTYSQLMDIVKVFPKLKFTILCGPPGTGKSKLFRNIVKEEYLTISVHATPLKIYQKIYDYAKEKNFQEVRLLIDDLDFFEQNTTIISLFKKFTETDDETELQYNSTSKKMEGYPDNFKLYNSSLTIICNDFNQSMRNKAYINALKNRSFFVEFNPDSKEIFKFLESFGKDIQALTFLKRYVLYSKNFSLRSYIKLIALKKYVKDWEDIMKKDLLIDEVEYVLNSNLPNNKKVLEISRLRKCGIRNAQIILKKRKGK